MEYKMPRDEHAERAVIGACLLSSEALGKVTELLTAEDFYDVSNRMSYEICLDMYALNRPVDLITFQSEAMSRGWFDRIGGQPYLAEVVGNDLVVLHAEYYAEIVRDMSVHRRIMEAGNKILRLGTKMNKEGGELMEEMEKIVLGVGQERESTGPVSLQIAKLSVLSKIEELRTGERKNAVYMSGFMDLDRILGGFKPGTLNIIAARPSMGKTALALNIAQFGKSVEDNGSILFFSLEMSSEQLIHRMLSAQSLECGMGVEVSALTTGIMSEDISEMLKEAVDALQGKIYIYDSSVLSAVEFRTKSRLFKMRNPDLSLIVVDYLQLMSSGSRRNENRQYEVAEISRMLKSTAVELNCPILALSQLSRETERRTEKKPQLSDLRDSGAIEQDADTVIMLYREDYYGDNENNDALDSKADIRVAKNRNGETGMCHLLFRRNYTRFVNYGGNM